MMEMGFDASKYESTLKETSRDDVNEYLLEDADEVYNLDNVAKFLAQKLKMPGLTRNTSDALHIDENKNVIYLIEFKNRNFRQIKKIKQEILLKVYESIFILEWTFCKGQTKEQLSEKIVYFVVFNEDKEKNTIETEPSYEKIVNTMEKLAKSAKKKERTADLQFDKLQGILFKEVHVIDVKTFLSDYKEKVFAQ